MERAERNNRLRFGNDFPDPYLKPGQRPGYFDCPAVQDLFEFALRIGHPIRWTSTFLIADGIRSIPHAEFAKMPEQYSSHLLHALIDSQAERRKTAFDRPGNEYDESWRHISEKSG